MTADSAPDRSCRHSLFHRARRTGERDRGSDFAQATGSSPWENAVNVLMTAFTSTIARGLSLVAIVVSGLTFAFGEGGSKRILAGVLFGVGMAIAAVNFMAWLFP